MTRAAAVDIVPGMKRSIAWVWMLFVISLLDMTAAAQKPIVVDNLGDQAQSSWVTCGLPPGVAPMHRCGYLEDAETEQRHLYVIGDRCVRVRLLDVKPGRHKLTWTDAEAKPNFEIAAGIDLAAMLPRWWYEGQLSELPQLWMPGAPQPDSFARVIEQDEAHVLFHVRSQHRAPRLHHDLWATVWSGQKQVDWVTISVYGDTRNDGQAPEIDLSALWLCDRTEKWTDFRREVGIGQNSHNADGTWVVKLNQDPTRLMRGRRIVTRGVWSPDDSRKGPPLTAIYSDWGTNWFGAGLGDVPKDAPQDIVQARARYLSGAFVGYFSARPYVQPLWSETTGEQPGFGAFPLGRAVALVEPWFVHSALWSCDSYAYRPTGNREPNGEPFAASRHPNAVAFGHSIEERFSSADLIGWPKAEQAAQMTTWWNGATPSEQQHRDALTLHATIALTRDPALQSIVADHLELERCDIMRKQKRVGAGRALGRLLLDFCGAAWGGVDGYRPLIAQMLDDCEQEIARHPGDMFLLGELSEAKYGWQESNGAPVIGGQHWQNMIAMQGLWRAWLVTGDKRAREWALRAARQTVEFAFFEAAGRWHHVYAWAWRGGQKAPASAFTGATNEWLNVDNAADYWDLSAAELLVRQEPKTTLGVKAAKLLQVYGPPSNWVQAQWRGLR